MAIVAGDDVASFRFVAWVDVSDTHILIQRHLNKSHASSLTIFISIVHLSVACAFVGVRGRWLRAEV